MFAVFGGVLDVKISERVGVIGSQLFALRVLRFEIVGTRNGFRACGSKSFFQKGCTEKSSGIRVAGFTSPAPGIQVLGSGLMAVPLLALI